MTFISGVLIFFICVGFGLIIFSIFRKENAKNSGLGVTELENAVTLADKSVEEADKAMEELNKLSQSIFEELEEKYQEILFLYQMLDEKQNEAKKDVGTIKSASEDNLKKSSGTTRSGKTKSQSKAEVYTNPKLEEIMKLKQEGMSVSEIAQKLDMGKGEVKLISELGKLR